jgi:cell division protein FtsB
MVFLRKVINMTEEEYKNELVRLKKENQELKLQIKELNTDKLTRLDTRASGEKNSIIILKVMFLKIILILMD